MGKKPVKLTRLLLSGFTLLAIFSVSCGPVHQAVQANPDDIRNVRKLAVVVPNDGSFTVLLDRATATQTPAVLFGLIGAAIASAHNQSRDNEKMAALAPQLKEFSTRATLVESFSKPLKDSGRLSELRVFEKAPARNEAEKYDAVLTLNIKDWGLRLPARDEERLAGFIELETTMLRIKDGLTLWNEHDTVLGQRRHFYSEYKDDANMLRTEIRETVQSAGARMAARVAYPRGRTN